jgi:phage/plasmid-associated DNA primase
LTSRTTCWRCRAATADPALAEQLAAERDGILNWLLAGWRMYREEGLRVPPGVQAAVADYRAQGDVVARFVAECCGEGGGQAHKR